MAKEHRILIVDDHPINILLMEELLDDAYEVATATSGEEAMTLAADFVPDLILLDVMMPGIDGYETCRRLRAAPGLGPTKIIFVSAKSRSEDLAQGYAAGADDYITKPFENGNLLRKVNDSFA
ncbi:MAG: response regulator [Candidatus Tectomicrobia bacterium]|nr:response regulator [Candidatus Tectomicrobia bacterium]